MKTEFLIIGAGPAGLGAAYRLRDLGVSDYHILEASDSVGGLARSFVDPKGFTWDIGGHVQFSHYEYFDRVMDEALGKEGWLYHDRESWVWMHDRFVPYPFQNNIRFLPKEAMWKCFKGIIDATKRAGTAPPPANFKEWIISIFGEGIADEFMVPYNFKVWAFPPEEMAFQWIGERVSVVDITRVSENIIFEKDDVSWGPNNRFRFPRNGGTGAIWNSVADTVGRSKIDLNTSVTSIDPAAKTATTSDGRTITYTHLLSTIPVNILAGLVSGVSASIRETANRLKYSASNIIGIGIKGQPKPELATKCWMYFPESNCPFYRVTLFSRYSPNNVPDVGSYFSLMTETSESTAKPVDQKNIIEDTVRGLRATKLIGDGDEVVSSWSYRAAYGYPTPSIERDSILRTVIPALDGLGVYSRGRFGGWKYEVSNQDHTFMQGVEWASWKVEGTPETTFTLG